MGEFIVNTAQWKRWVLPDGEHLYDSYLYGDRFTIKIINRLTNETVSSHTIVIDGDAGQWKNLLELSQELANKKYGKRAGWAKPDPHPHSGRLGSNLGKI